MTQKQSLSTQIEQILAEENAQIELKSWRGKFKRIWRSENKKQAIKTECWIILKGLSKKAWFTLFVIFAFIFMLVMPVI
jgi:hypothetical protein